MKRKYRILKNNQTNKFRAEYREWWCFLWLTCHMVEVRGWQEIEEYPDLQQAIEAVERHQADRWVVVSEI